MIAKGITPPSRRRKRKKTGGRRPAASASEAALNMLREKRTRLAETIDKDAFEKLLGADDDSLAPLQPLDMQSAPAETKQAEPTTTASTIAADAAAVTSSAPNKPLRLASVLGLVRRSRLNSRSSPKVAPRVPAARRAPVQPLAAAATATATAEETKADAKMAPEAKEESATDAAPAVRIEDLVQVDTDVVPEVDPDEQMAHEDDDFHEDDDDDEDDEDEEHATAKEQMGFNRQNDDDDEFDYDD